MKTTALLLASAIAALAQSPEHLGTLTQNTRIPLTRADLNRPDFACYHVTAVSLLQTNLVAEFDTTNNFLDLTNFPQLLSGRALLGVRSESVSGLESSPNVYTFDIFRDAPAAPIAGKVITVFGGSGGAQGDAEKLERLLMSVGRSNLARHPSPPQPPSPSGMGAQRAVLPPNRQPEPLKGTNTTYGQFLDRQAETAMRLFYSRKSRQ